jgi:hypothetical protein
MLNVIMPRGVKPNVVAPSLDTLYHKLQTSSMQRFQNALAFIAMGVSYTRKMSMKSTPDHQTRLSKSMTSQKLTLLTLTTMTLKKSMTTERFLQILSGWLL